MAGGDSAGGSFVLAGLIEEHCEALYADLMETYRVNLVDALGERPDLSPSEYLILIRGLPLTSRWQAERQGGKEYEGWGIDQYQMSSLIDSVRENTFVLLSAHSGKKKPKPPEPSYRPGKKKTQKVNAFTAIAKSKAEAARKARGG